MTARTIHDVLLRPVVSEKSVAQIERNNYTFAVRPDANKLQIKAAVDWGTVATCKEAGVDVEYQMLRGIFTTPGVSQEVTDFYVGLMEKVRETQEWKDFMTKGAFTQTFKSGDDFKTWVAGAADLHKDLMTKAGFLSN